MTITQETARQLNVIMDIFNKYPKKIFINRNVFCLQHHLIKNKKEHINKLKTFRNLFNYFCVDTKKTTFSMTSKYLKQISKNKNHLMYCIFYKNKLIGEYGLKYLGKKRISLDAALRFSTLGGKNLFNLIQKTFFKLILKNNQGFYILIIVNKNNFVAINMHKKFNFKNAKLLCDVKDLVLYVKSKSKNPNDFFIKGIKAIKK